MNTAENRAFFGILIAILIGIGLALAGSQGGVKAFGVPVFALAVGLAFLIQWVAFIPAYLKRTESFYDLTGSITYTLVTLVAVLLSPPRDARTFLLLGLVIVWAARLGSFLFLRIKKAGEDRRFREIKSSFSRFLLAWTLQGLWVTFSLAAALAAITATDKLPLGPFALVGFLVWLLGFGFEVVADQQKSKFNASPENAGKFISTGLWSWSRHPNYFGEIVLWVGVAIIALPLLSGWTYLALISPVFIYVLLTRISGVPMLEKRADEKWGGQPDYEAYKARTSVLVPLPPRK
jgi:steroid 5-alpha reductase family enzyme